MQHENYLPLRDRATLSPAIAAWHTLLAMVVALAATVSQARAQGTPVPERQLAPGVLTTIAPSFEPNDTVSTHNLVEMHADPDLKWQPEFLADTDTLVGRSTGVKFRRDIWCLEFSFKPMRMIEVDLPSKSGGTERKLVWYLVYKVRNTGQVLRPVEGDGNVYTTEMAKGGPIRFLPQFILESNDLGQDGKQVPKAYLDRVIPAAVNAINQREKQGRKLLNSVEISETPIPVSDGRIDRGVWGVATWIDVDPRIDFFSVYVAGLTNAYRWEDVPGAYRPGDFPGKGREFVRKMLQINFWRPGDELHQNESEIRYGVPLGKADLYGVGEGVAYRWVYR